MKNSDGKRLKNLLLYGSWARAEATEDSDIDLVLCHS
ncbi:MAG: nucleotidyltransferase domain-containing protein [bacterium]